MSAGHSLTNSESSQKDRVFPKGNRAALGQIPMTGTKVTLRLLATAGVLVDDNHAIVVVSHPEAMASAALVLCHRTDGGIRRDKQKDPLYIPAAGFGSLTLTPWALDVGPAVFHARSSRRIVPWPRILGEERIHGAA